MRHVNFRCPRADKLNVSHSFLLRPRFSCCCCFLNFAAPRRALWRELVVRVSILKLSKEFRFECFASTTQHFMRCALLVVVCCGVRLAAVSLYFAKRKEAILWRGKQEGTARMSEDRVPAGHFSFLFVKKSGENHSSHTQPRSNN